MAKQKTVFEANNPELVLETEETPEQIEAKRVEAERIAEEARLEEGKVEAERLRLEAETEAARLAEEEKEKKEKPEGENVLSLIDLLQTSPAEGEKKPEIPKAEFTPEQIEKLAKAEALENNPLVKAFELGATAADIKKIAKELAGEDFSKVPFAELLKTEIARETGLEGEDLVAAVEEELLTHDSLTTYQKGVKEKELRAKFNTAGGESATLKKLEEVYAALPKPESEEVIKGKIAKVIEEETGQIVAKNR